MLLGLTGGYCAGKNAVAAILEERGWTCIDVDTLGHEALSLAAGQVAARFGTGLLAPDGTIDRRALGRIVFADPEALAALESITHPIMFRLVDARIAAARQSGPAGPASGEGEEAGSGGGICLNAAVLYRMPQAASCDVILEVKAPFLVRLIRGVARDDLSLIEAAKRILRQRRLWRRRHTAGVPILSLRNDGPRDSLLPKVLHCLDHARRLVVRRSRAPKRRGRTETRAEKPSPDRPNRR